MITDKIINEHQELYNEIYELKELQSENIKTIKAQHEEDEVEVVDPQTKKQVKVREKDLWQETHYLGFGDNRAGNYFREKYPDIFERDEKIVELGEKIAKFEVKNFGFKLKEMTPPRMLELIQVMVKKEVSATPVNFSQKDKETLAREIAKRIDEYQAK